MRIVAGLAKGRRLTAPAEGTRPTSDRAREAMFNTLDSRMDLDGARVLDLYAGTGAVGLEALSRGASTAVFVEKARPAVAILRRNIETVGVSGAVVVASDVGTFLDREQDGFDLVFADPPYALPADEMQAVVARLGQGWLAAGAVVVVERAVDSPPPFGADRWLTPIAEKRYGDSVLWYGRAR